MTTVLICQGIENHKSANDLEEAKRMMRDVINSGAALEKVLCKKLNVASFTVFLHFICDEILPTLQFISV